MGSCVYMAGLKTNKGQHAIFKLCHSPLLLIPSLHSFYFPLVIMVKTQEKNKNTHPGQPMDPRPRKSKEQAAAECAAKVAASQKKANERFDQIAGLASLEQHIVGESQQVMAQAA